MYAVPTQKYLLIPITNSTISSTKDAKKELISFDKNSTLILALLRKLLTQKARKKRESKLKFLRIIMSKR